MKRARALLPALIGNRLFGGRLRGFGYASAPSAASRWPIQ